MKTKQNNLISYITFGFFVIEKLYIILCHFSLYSNLIFINLNRVLNYNFPFLKYVFSRKL